MASFGDRLAEAVKRRRNPALVGLDPRVANLPAGLLPTDPKSPAEVAGAFAEFCRLVIDVVAPLVPAVKPQAAFFEQYGPHGMNALAEVIRYARERDLLVIVDAKRNDIGSTAKAYAEAYLGRPPATVWGADALTVSPYLGDDSLTPFVEAADANEAGIFVLVKTSNPGGGLFQDLVSDGKKLYQLVAEHVESLNESRIGTSGYGGMGAVVGATYPDQLVELRQTMPHSWILVPGFGAQGGSAEDVAGGFDERGLGAIVNSSRGIIFAHERPSIGTSTAGRIGNGRVEAATQAMIDQLRGETSAGKL